jgi:hypothetical protein
MAVAGSIVAVASDLGRGLTKYVITWTSDASGVVSEVAVELKTGRLIQARYAPGVAAPTDQYDLTLKDAIAGADILIGGGANQSATVPAFSTPTNPPVIEGGNFYPTVANAGNAKNGVLTLYVLGA